MSVGRYAPSPTGTLHVGNLRTALVAWLWSRHGGSAFRMRFEDHDRHQAAAEHEAAQLRDLAALGIDWDEPVTRTSDRWERYAAVLDDLIARDLTFPCWCSRRDIREAAAAPHTPVEGYPGTCRDLDAAGRADRAASSRVEAPSLRLRGGGHVERFVDAVVGPVDGVVDDIVLRRGDGLPSYNLTVSVDEIDEGIELVVRADDLVPVTAAQIRIIGLLGGTAPTYAHVPLAVAPGTGRRLAKRDGAVTLGELETTGWTATGVRTELVRSLGLCGPEDVPSPAELVASFDPADLVREPWTYDLDERSPW